MVYSPEWVRIPTPKEVQHPVQKRPPDIKNKIARTISRIIKVPDQIFDLKEPRFRVAIEFFAVL